MKRPDEPEGPEGEAQPPRGILSERLGRWSRLERDFVSARPSLSHTLSVFSLSVQRRCHSFASKYATSSHTAATRSSAPSVTSPPSLAPMARASPTSWTPSLSFSVSSLPSSAPASSRISSTVAVDSPETRMARALAPLSRSRMTRKRAKVKAKVRQPRRGCLPFTRMRTRRNGVSNEREYKFAHKRAYTRLRVGGACMLASLC